MYNDNTLILYNILAHIGRQDTRLSSGRPWKISNSFYSKSLHTALSMHDSRLLFWYLGLYIILQWIGWTSCRCISNDSYNIREISLIKRLFKHDLYSCCLLSWISTNVYRISIRNMCLMEGLQCWHSYT